MKITREIKITRGIDREKVRQICIDYQYYTRGGSEAYSRMLGMAHKDMTDLEYFIMAEDIFNHSAVDVSCKEYGCSEDEFLASIISNLINGSWHHVEIVKEEEE